MAHMEPSDKYALEINPARGEWPSLSTELENMLKHFVVDAQKIGVPRSKSKIAVDIQEYVRLEKLEVPFRNGKPGKSNLTLSW